jgi:hypothetical protein
MITLVLFVLIKIMYIVIAYIAIIVECVMIVLSYFINTSSLKNVLAVEN